MAELSCRCLNVTIHLDSSEVQFGSSVKPSNLLINMKKESSFDDLYEVKLGMAGIAIIHNCLMHSYQSGDWIIHGCANCGIDTHVTHSVKGDNKVFVSNKVEVDQTKIEELRRNVNFSKVFKVVLSDAMKDETVEQQRAFAMSLGNNDPAMKQLQQQMKTYLNKEETALEDRIMAFEKEQREAFSRLCNKVHKETGLIVRSLTKAKASATTEVRSQEQANMEFITKSGPMMGQRNQSLCSSNNSSNSSSPGQQSEVTIMVQDKLLGDKGMMISKDDGFEDALFGMDGVDVDNQTTHFIQSDDDDESTSTDDSYRDELTHSSHSVNVAQSLPITVPLYSTYKRPSERQDEKVHIAPSQMAESIKALALSVHQETEIFGDLPKPRTNSCTWAR